MKSSKGSKDRFVTEKVPCGRCPDCTKSRRSSWVYRLKEEDKYSLSSAFITYTYNDENLCWTKKGLATLNKKDHQDYIKRLRINLKRLDYKEEIRYYTVGEYGTTTHRPHLHSIVFNLPNFILDKIDLNNNSDILGNIWQKGHVRIDEVTSSSIAYVAGYCQKKLAPIIQRPNDDREPEFSMMSKGLGKSFLTPQMVKFYQENELPYLIKEDGAKQIMPRYYKDKIYTDTQKLRIATKVKNYIEKNPRYRDDKHEYELVKHKFEERERLLREKRVKL